MANETMRIFIPLKIVTYPQGEYGTEGTGGVQRRTMMVNVNYNKLSTYFYSLLLIY